MRKGLFWVFFFLLFTASSLCSQGTDMATLDSATASQCSDATPTIGLTLSGGSAHGCAHIGVIKYMEELGIPVDNITGTSMGSIVGGLLAMGYGSDDMVAISESMEWDKVLSNRTDLDHIAPLEKFYHDKFPILFTLADKELLFPSGIISGQSLDMVISRLYFPALSVDKFDDLIIPFKCMAVDISTGDVLTLDSGYLGKAIRASMAIPLIFSPVELDGRLLVDGGLIRNFPVQENIEMGSDFIIGVYVGSEKEPKEKLKSSFDILAQSTQLMGIMDSEKQMELCDILIKPDVKEYPTLEFNNAEFLIERGYQEAKKHKEAFLALKERIANRKIEDKSQSKFERPKKIYVNKVTAPDLNSSMSDIILNRCGLSQKSYIKLDDIDEGLSRIYGTKNFKKLDYTFTQDENLNTNLQINAETSKELEVGATFNRFGSTNSSIILFGVLRNKINEPSRLTVASRLSDNPGVRVDYFRRFGHHRQVFFRSFLNAERFELPLFLDGDLRRLFRSRNLDIGLNIGYETDNALKVEGGIRYSSQSLKPIILQEDDIILYDQNQIRLSLEGTYNTLDKSAYPTKGISALARVNYNFGRSVDEEYTTREAREAFFVEEDDVTFSIFGSLQVIYSLNPKITTISSGYTYSRIGSSLLDNLALGGTEQSRINNVPFIGLGEGELLFSTAAVLRQEVRINPLRNVFLSAIGNIAVGGKAFGSLIMDFDNSDIIGGIGINVGLNTPLGPIDLNVGANTGGMGSAILGAGYRFVF